MDVIAHEIHINLNPMKISTHTVGLYPIVYLGDQQIWGWNICI